MSTRRTASSQKKSAMARKKTPRRGGSRGRRRSSSFFATLSPLGVVDRRNGGYRALCLSVLSFLCRSNWFRWRALYGDAEYPEGYEIHGIDISHYQGKIDWEQLKNAMIKGCPVRFVIIKSTEGSSRLDENFRENFNQARDFGFIRGCLSFLEQ